MKVNPLEIMKLIGCEKVFKKSLYIMNTQPPETMEFDVEMNIMKLSSRELDVTIDPLDDTITIFNLTPGNKNEILIDCESKNIYQMYFTDSIPTISYDNKGGSNIIKQVKLLENVFNDITYLSMYGDKYFVTLSYTFSIYSNISNVLNDVKIINNLEQILNNEYFVTYYNINNDNIVNVNKFDKNESTNKIYFDKYNERLLKIFDKNDDIWVNNNYVIHKDHNGNVLINGSKTKTHIIEVPYSTLFLMNDKVLIGNDEIVHIIDTPKIVNYVNEIFSKEDDVYFDYVGNTRKSLMIVYDKIDKNCENIKSLKDYTIILIDLEKDKIKCYG